MQWNDWLGVIGSVGSLAGLVISIVVLQTVRKLRTRYVRQGVLTQCADKLKSHQRSLKSAITKKNLSSVRQYLGRIKAIRERIKLHQGEGDGITLIASELEAVLRTGDADLLDEANRMLPALEELVEQVDLTIAEMEWGKHDE